MFTFASQKLKLRKRIIMKKLILGFFLTTSAFMFQGCDTSEILGTFTSQIDGTAWQAIAPAAVKAGGTFTITGLSADKQIVLHVGGIVNGEYDASVLVGNLNPVVYTPNIKQPQTTFVSTGGKITITNVTDKKVSGQFNVDLQSTSATIKATGNFVNVNYSI